MIDLTGRDQSWWPDLTGKTVAIMASGPSLTKAQCDTARDAGWYGITINETWRLAEWAHMRYGCDWHWWQSCAPRDKYDGLSVIGSLPKKNGRQYLPPEMKWQTKKLRYVHVKPGSMQLMWEGHHLGAGKNGGFQAVNLAVRCGAKRLVLMGVDCHSPNAHWHGNHSHPQAGSQHQSLMNEWIRAWQNAAKDMRQRGIRCVNCSPGSAVNCFKAMTVEKAAEFYA